MSEPLSFIVQILGVGTLCVLILGVIATVFVFSLWLLMKFTPRLHAGRPLNPGELRFYDYRSIITDKDGKRIESVPKLLNAPLSLKWWFGLSYRPAPKWFIGVIRWEPKED